MKKSIYEELGVDPHKSAVKDIFAKIIRKDFPNAFCNIVKDAKRRGYVRTKHSDGSGSKSVQRVLHYLETGEEEIFQDDVFDALSMNTGDIAASGFVERYDLTQTIAINSGNVNKDVILRQNALGWIKAIELYRQYGIELVLFGGETADLPDQTNSYILDMDVSANAREWEIIKGDICPGDTIFGFSSGGRAVWEGALNSGQMSNGLTLSRTGLMHKDYAAKYPFLCRPDKAYRGRYSVHDKVDGVGRISDAILSPTRQWVIVIKLLIDELKMRNSLDLLHGIVMNTGGGATKIKNIGENINYCKYVPFEILPYFKFIQAETEESWENMFVTFNMGVGLDIIGSNHNYILSKAIRAVSEKTGIESFNLGSCHKGNGKNSVSLLTKYGTFEY